MSPAGFARGFCAPTDEVEVHKCTGIYNGNADGICWDDPDEGIEWPLKEVRVSDKDRNAQSLRHFTYEPSAVFSR
jgi:dTDP-4-dehydrorhamnose 3,5-epimerase